MRRRTTPQTDLQPILDPLRWKPGSDADRGRQRPQRRHPKRSPRDAVPSRPAEPVPPVLRPLRMAAVFRSALTRRRASAARSLFGHGLPDKPRSGYHEPRRDGRTPDRSCRIRDTGSARSGSWCRGPLSCSDPGSALRFAPSTNGVFAITQRQAGGCPLPGRRRVRIWLG